MITIEGAAVPGVRLNRVLTAQGVARSTWYAVTAIDYSSRYLHACHVTPSYCAQDVTAALDVACAEAERLHEPLAKVPAPVTDNGSSSLARHFQRHIDSAYAHVRTQHRTPT